MDFGAQWREEIPPGCNGERRVSVICLIKPIIPMKNLRVAVILAAGVVWAGVSPAAFAKKPDARPNNDRAALIERMGERLGLTAEQKAKLDALREKERTQIQSIRDDASLSVEQKREKIRGAMRGLREETESVLSAEQREKLQQARRRMADRFGQAGGPPRMGPWQEGARGDFRKGFAHPFPGRGAPMMQRGRGFGPGMGPGFKPGAGPWSGPGKGRGFGPSGSRFGSQGRFPGPQMRPGFGMPFMEGIVPRLGLTEEQKAKARELHEGQREKVENLMKAGRDEFRALLTPEQQKKFDAERPAPKRK